MRKGCYLLVIFFLFCVCAEKNDAENLKDDFALSLHGKLFQKSLNNQKTVFYPKWTTKNGIIPLADTLIDIIKKSNLDGLDPGEYHLREIENILHHSLNYENRKKLSELLTDAFVLISTHHYTGRICSEKEGNIDWFKHVQEINPIDSLKRVFQNGGIKKMVFSFSCKHDQYVALQKALLEYIYLQKAGGLQILPSNFTSNQVEKGSRILLLRKRLALSNDLIPKESINDSTFDETLRESIKAFQYKYNLNVNGKISKALIKELNIPVEKRIQQIAFNMERWRWLPRILPYTYINVNIANFTLSLEQNKRNILQMKIIAGTTFHPTPLFHSSMSYVILNPGWDIPKSIAVNEILPQLKKNNCYLLENDIKLYESREPNAEIIDARKILWDSISQKNFHYRLRQMPGPDNPLGSMKFMFPNINYVYFHDTPYRELFYKTLRAFSHGCIRIEKPLELASFLLKKDTTWIKNKLNDAVTKKKEIKLIIPSEEEVFICYWTTYIDESGKLCFKKDIYQYDKRMEEFMKTKKCIPNFINSNSLTPQKDSEQY